MVYVTEYKQSVNHIQTTHYCDIYKCDGIFVLIDLKKKKKHRKDILQRSYRPYTEQEMTKKRKDGRNFELKRELWIMEYIRSYIFFTDA